MSEAVSRVRLGPIQNPVRGVLQVGAALLAAATTVEFAMAHGVASEVRTALLTFAVTAVALFTVSTAYHVLPWSPLWKRRMQRTDHAMIYFQIAGATTAFAVVALRDAERELLIGAAWAIAVIGAAQKTWLPHIHEKASIPFQVLQALLGVPALLAFSERFPDRTPELVLACSLYSTGAVIFVSGRPRLWPRVFSFHELFHVMIVAGYCLIWVLLSDALRGA